MKLLINIPDGMYKSVKDGLWCGNEIVRYAIEHSTPIPDNATNGDVIKALFPDSARAIHQSGGLTSVLFQPSVMLEDRTSEWWNAPYKADKE